MTDLDPDSDRLQDRIDDLLAFVDEDAERQPDTSSHKDEVRDQCEGDVELPDVDDVKPSRVTGDDLRVDLDD